MAPGLLFSGVLLCLSFALSVEVVAHLPDVVYTKFPREGSLKFFANSTSALYVDRRENGTIHVTRDDGKTWVEANLPSGVRKDVTLHPFDNRYAFVETSEGPYYRTTDRGLTWQPFEMPTSPSYTMEHFSFHSHPSSSAHILINGNRCVNHEQQGERCHTDYYYTRDAFSSEPTLLLRNAESCRFAHSSKDFVHEEHRDLIFCVAAEWSDNAPFSGRLHASSDFFNDDKRVVDFGLKRNSYHVSDFSFIGRFAVVGLYSFSNLHSDFSHIVFISSDLKHWEQLRVADLHDSLSLFALTTSKLGTSDNNWGVPGSLFVSDSNGTNFVEALKNVDNTIWTRSFETDNIAGVEHISLANIVANPEETGNWGKAKLRSRISFDDGTFCSTWERIVPSSEDASSSTLACDHGDVEACSLHFSRRARSDNNYFRNYKALLDTSSPAAGVAIRVGSLGSHLAPSEDCDTFITVNAGVNWSILMKGPHMFEYANHGSLIVLVKDSGDTDELTYSNNSGKSWSTLKMEHRIRPIDVFAAPDAMSQKFLLIGRVAHEDDNDIHSGEIVIVALDFSYGRGRECTEDDFERWFIRDGDANRCILGHKQWYLRRKLGRDCYIARSFEQDLLTGVEEFCPCAEADYECDFNYIREGKDCVPAVPESIPPGACHSSSGTYLGPSGYRLKAGSICSKRGGYVLDSPVEKDCAPPRLPEGEIGHKVFEFPTEVVQSQYLHQDSKTILVRLRDGTIWQSSNEGYTWSQLLPEERFLTFITHPYSPYRAYLLTHSDKYFYTTDEGRSWNPQRAPVSPNTFGAATIAFNPKADYLIWVGDADCSGTQAAINCHAEAYYSTNHGRMWNLIEQYVRNCAWTQEAELSLEVTKILCESYEEKKGNQRHFSLMTNPLLLIISDLYKERHVMFRGVIGSVRYSHHLLVAQYKEDTRGIALQVARDGATFSEAIFPSDLHPQNRAYAMLESTSESIFIHLTTSEHPNPPWGVILKSGVDGIVYAQSLDYVNRNDRGNIDFIKLPVLRGIMLANVVADPGDSMITGRKELVTKISHNDGGIWKSLIAPIKDSNDQDYLCSTEDCGLHLHAFSERPNSRSFLATPSRPDLLISVGNVGDVLAPYKECSTLLSRDAGFTWSEIRKDTHVWAIGDRGSLLVMARDSVPTDRVIYSTDEGLTWHEYKLKGQRKIRVRSILTVSNDSTRRFIIFGHYPLSMDAAVAIQLDFSFLTMRGCTINDENPSESDFELWSPSEERQERCLSGKQAIYQRRIRERNCYIGDLALFNEVIIRNCACTAADFECEFNHVRDETGVCVQLPGTPLLPNDALCSPGKGWWYERTAYRKIGFSTCEGGLRLDRGTEHECIEHIPESGTSRGKHGWLFWSIVAYLCLALLALFAYTVFRCSGFARGKIRLAEDEHRETRASSSLVMVIATSPLFVGGFIVRASRRIAQMLPFGSRKNGQNLAGIGQDEHLLFFEEERGR